MIESLLRLALVAGTGASMASLQRTGRRVAICVGVAIAVGLIAAAALVCFAMAAWYALLPQVGPAGAAAIIGLVLVVIAALIWAIAARRHRRTVLPATPLAGGLLPPQLPDIDISGLLERHAGSILLAAFAAGMFLNRRR